MRFKEGIAAILLKPDAIRYQLIHALMHYGPLPGIREAEFEAKTAEIVGTRIRVTNRDGSTHVEEIVEWEPTRRPDEGGPVF